jgi:hypothetical protein
MYKGGSKWGQKEFWNYVAVNKNIENNKIKNNGIRANGI